MYFLKSAPKFRVIEFFVDNQFLIRLIFHSFTTHVPPIFEACSRLKRIMRFNPEHGWYMYRRWYGNGHSVLY